MKALLKFKFILVSFFVMALYNSMSGQAIQSENTNEIQMNSTYGTAHIKLIEDDASPGGSTRIEMRNADNATDRFEIRSFLHPSTDHRIGWSYNNLFRVVWNEDNDGFGIGTSYPDEKLEVSGAIKIGNTSNNNNGTIRYTGTDFEGYVGGSWMSLTGAPSPWSTTGSDIYFNSGDVGINMMNPDKPLHVGGTTKIEMNSTTGAPHLLLLEDDTSPGGTTRLEMRNSNNATDRFEIRSYLHPSLDHIIGWSYNNNFRVAWNEDDDGFGIGTSSPIEKLQVTGAINLGNTTSNNAGTIRYTGSDFEGYVGGTWKSLTAGSTTLAPDNTESFRGTTDSENNDAPVFGELSNHNYTVNQEQQIDITVLQNENAQLRNELDTLKKLVNSLLDKE